MSAADRTRFVRLTFKDKGTKPFFIRVTSESEDFIVGTEVNRQNEEVRPIGFDARTHIVGKAAIATLTEYRENLTYGTLEKLS